MNNRFKNPYFWLGLIGVFFTSAGVAIEDLTSWSILIEKIVSVLNNPFLILCTVTALIGVFVEPTTKGLKDGR